MKRILSLLLFCIFICSPLLAQITSQPIKWGAEVVPIKDNIYEICVIGTIYDSKWHIYDLTDYGDMGPNPTKLTINTNSNVRLLGKPYVKSEVHKAYDEMFGIEIGTCGGEVVICQKVEAIKSENIKIEAVIEWQACDNRSCLPPAEESLNIMIPAKKALALTNVQEKLNEKIDTNSAESVESAESANAVSNSSSVDNTNNASTVSDNIIDASAIQQPSGQINIVEEEFITDASKRSKKSLWGVILEAIGWGFVALLTPCVFPMVPMTVSFFLKQNQGKEGHDVKKGRGKFLAGVFGFSIIALYTLPIAIIILVTYIAGGEAVTADIFNWLATHWIPNILFFLIFMLFAASFFGAFEITLPSWMINKSDSQSEKGGLAGVFFVALTLVLVSFSCTGPIVGSVLIKSTQGDVWEPIITMLAFSIAFALPFTIFAFAPSLLKNLPKSGGWLNSVKVVLGFVEVALGFKFLSVADQTYHWGLLDREVYLAIWIVVFTLLGLYLLGKIKFAYDSPIEHLSVFRLILVIVDFTFVVYMIPGMWGAPLKALSGYLPPITTQDFNLDIQLSKSQQGDTYQVGTQTALGGNGVPANRKYSDFLHMPYGIEAFFDYNEAREYAKKVGKPLFIDFTGHGCVNCREMETRVWSDPRALKLMKENYVVCALYADDKKTVAENDWVVTDSGKTLKTLGKINSHFALTKFNVNAQPYYAILDPNTEEHKMPSRGYNLDVEEFVKFLEGGLK